MIDAVLSEAGLLRVLKSNTSYWAMIKAIEQEYDLPPLGDESRFTEDGAWDRWTEDCQRKGIERPLTDLFADILDLNEEYDLPFVVFTLLFRVYCDGIVDGALQPEVGTDAEGRYTVEGTTVSVERRALGFWQWEFTVPFWPEEGQSLKDIQLSHIVAKEVPMGVGTNVPPNSFVVLGQDPAETVCWLIGTEGKESRGALLQTRWYLGMPCVPTDARLLGAASLKVVDAQLSDFRYDRAVLASLPRYKHRIVMPTLLDALAGGLSGDGGLRAIDPGPRLDLDSVLSRAKPVQANGTEVETPDNPVDGLGVDALDSLANTWWGKYKEEMAKGVAMNAHRFAEHLGLTDGLPMDVWFAFYHLAKDKLGLKITLEYVARRMGYHSAYVRTQHLGYLRAVEQARTRI